MRPLQSESIAPWSIAAVLWAALSAADARAADLPPVVGDRLALELVSSRLDRPVLVTAPPGDREHIWIVGQNGAIRVVDLATDTLLPAPFLSLPAGSLARFGERGLLSLAFDPDYAENGFFYIYYSSPQVPDGVCSVCVTFACDHVSRVSRFRVSAEDPLRADPASEEILLEIDQPYSNHNGGQLAFSPLDGYLYIGLGDGGDADDPCELAQNPAFLLGKMLRIDVGTREEGRAYGIPADNPFVGVEGVRPEIWAMGLRNPWRFSFDRETGDLYIGDVGQGRWEEIDFQPGSSEGGENYGWDRFEGLQLHENTPLGPGVLTDPIVEYPHSGPAFRGCSVTGGFVYRGQRLPELHGVYFFSDYCQAWIRTLRVVDGAAMELRDRTAELNGSLVGDVLDEISAFGEDGRGELYICDLDTKVFRIVAAEPVVLDEPPVAVAIVASATVGLVGGAASTEVDASASHDGNDGAQGLEYAWSVVDGPASVSFDDPVAAVTVARFTELGVYELRVVVSDGIGTAEATARVEVVEGTTPFRRADANVDGALDLSDGVSILLYLFGGAAEPACLDAADVDDDAEIALTDAIRIFSFLFLGGEPPAAPAECGEDPTEDELDCVAFAPCAA